jgi:predicted glycogen debranching enzyme
MTDTDTLPRPGPLVLRPVHWTLGRGADPLPLLSREWLVTNGLGGYASGTVSGVATRRYHGLLVAALPAPLGRMMMLNHLSERATTPDGAAARLGGHEWAGRLDVPALGTLADFRLEDGLPVWEYEVGGLRIEKRIVMPHQQNTVHVIYRLLSKSGTVRLRLRPALNIRPHDAPVDYPIAEPYELSVRGDRIEVRPCDDCPPLRFHVGTRRSAFVVAPGLIGRLHYRMEAARGYPETGDLWTPGTIRVDLRPDRPAMLTASVEPWAAILALDAEAARAAEHERRGRLLEAAEPGARQGPGAELVLAADQFLIRPSGRVEDEARARAAGDEVRTVIAGYHWFTDWGRDTMISLEGLTLNTGRHQEAGYILRTFAHYVRDGLIPNYFPDGRNEGVYHTADATLWFYHAIDRYLRATGDRETLGALLPTLRDILTHHRRGTRFGIGVDPADGLLRQGASGYQLTWMDAKVDGWVVTPRRGKAVEINALWYNALSLMAGWLREAGDKAEARRADDDADHAYASFNRRFWNESAGYLFDVIDGEHGDDPACRPNQLLAIALPHPVLDRARWEPVLEVVRERLLTPFGLRSLAPGHPDYKPYYDGDLRARDAAYHQGTVWAWLIGPYIDAWLKVHPEDCSGARGLLDGLIAHLGEAGVGSISEIFDAETPFTPRGCIAQAWSVAEVLRCWVNTAPE